MRRVAGIDPGKNGGIVILEGLKAIDARTMCWAGDELDGGTLAQVLREYEVDLVTMEKVHSMPRDGVKQAFAFGAAFGGVKGVVAAVGIPLQLVTPQAWKKLILAGTDHGKDAAISYTLRMYPAVNLFLTPRHRKAHDGMADAACIAEYGVRVFGRSAVAA